MTPKHKVVFIASALFTLFICSILFFFQMELRNKPLPVLGQIAPFTLQDSNGDPFTLDRLKGKTWVAAFLFTTCGDICPMMAKNLAALHRSYALRDDVAMVAITVNPEYDDPKVLTDYAKKLNADTDRWHFLTGSREAITELMLKSFKIGSMEEPVFHSSKFVLMDKKANIRGYYEGMEMKEIEQLFKDIAGTLKEK